MSSFFHFDPLNLVTVLFLAAVAWTKMGDRIHWYGKWIEKHDRECDENRKALTVLFTELKTANSKLLTLTEAQDYRIARLEAQADRAQHR